MSTELYQSICTKEFIDNDDNTLLNWIEKYGEKYKFEYLLAHAEDGIIWGKFDNSKLKIANNTFPAYCPKLRLLTLQQCRIFGKSVEILLWKTKQKWNARLTQDDPNQDFPEEAQILWGTKIELEGEDFTLLADGSQGLKHAVPLKDLSSYFSTDEMYRPIRLIVKHYIDYDNKTGIARISLSRLVSLKPEPKQGDK
jgi:CRISPR-associated protein (TIGR03984 family)